VFEACETHETFEISSRFRHTIEERIARLERDADFDESVISALISSDHIRRQMRLVSVQRAEALRLRLFLDRARIKSPGPDVRF
jgi:hypothetical protein